MIAREPEIVAAQVTDAGGWDIHVIKHGSLAGAGCSAPGVDPKPIVETLRITAAHVEPQPSPLPAGTAEEALDLMSWLESDGVRLVHLTNPLALPREVGGSWLQRYADARHALDAFIYEAGTRPAGPLARAATRISLTA
jgi:DNA polymerase-3 subunit epsilon